MIINNKVMLLIKSMPVQLLMKESDIVSIKKLSNNWGLLTFKSLVTRPDNTNMSQNLIVALPLH